ncbi:MAG: cytidine deaminase [Desulfurococcales archaeon]|nr:cytidine deaminase [Desulfurococcales archaeon]
MASRVIPEDMLELARRYRDRPYAPYSRFRVVSVVRGESGRLYVGVNVENASYGLTVCAERVAIFNAVTEGERRIREVLVYALDSDEPVFPCGACRQVIAEFSPDGSAIVYAYSAKTGKWGAALLRDLLPEAFKLETSE